MITNKPYLTDSIELADFDFECFESKEILQKMLDNSTPKPLEKFNTKGSCWDLESDIDFYFNLCINGYEIETSTCVSNFMEDFLQFLMVLAYYDDKSLICIFEYEGQYYYFSSIPLNEDKIRVSGFTSYDLECENPKLRTDFVIKKETFINQLVDILKEIVKDTKSESTKSQKWINKIKYTLGEIDKYFKNPPEWKKNFEPKRHIRVFDIAYKNLQNDWKFKIALEGENDANIMPWERKKRFGQILDYDFVEQFPQDLYKWNKDCTNMEKMTDEEIKDLISPDMDERIERNWVYSPDTKRWYSDKEIMPYTSEKILGVIHNRLSYSVEFCSSCFSDNEDEMLDSSVESNFDKNGNLIEEYIDSLTYLLKIKSSNSMIAEIKFDYKDHKQIREGLKKCANGEYARFNVDGDKLHLWQSIYHNSQTEESRDIDVVCYGDSDDPQTVKELYSFTANRNEFVDCFNNALDDVEYRIKIAKHIHDVGEKLKISEKFKTKKGYWNEIGYIENFNGGYACVKDESLDGWGIINKDFEWVIKPEHVDILGKKHPKYGQEIKGIIQKYYYLHNIDGKLFIAAKQDDKKYVMDINGDIQIPHVSDEIYYTYFNGELWFAAVDYNKSYIVNSKGEDVLTLDFPIGEKFWLFDDIVIVSKDNKFGIVDWKGKIIVDFIFSDINPEKDNLDFIPVKYVKQWGYINKNGKIFDMKIKDSSEADVKSSQVK